MFDLDTIPPMPAMRCPSWCTTDHLDEWAEQTSRIGKAYRLSAEDGVYAEGVISLEDVVENWEPFHHARLAHFDLGGNEHAVLDLQDDADEGAVLYLDAGGAFGSDTARALAAALIAGAERLDALKASA